MAEEQKTDEIKQVPLDIIMATHNHWQLTVNCLDALYRNTNPPFNLTVVDDSAEPNDLTMTILEWFKKEKGSINIIHSEVPYTHCNQIINIGLQNTQSPIVCYIGNNVRVEPNWLDDAISMMVGSDKIGIMGFKLLFPTGVIEHAGIVYQAGMPYHVNIGVGDAPSRHTQVKEVPAVGFALVLFRREVFPQGLDTTTYLGWRGFDDIDACLDAGQRGWKVVYCGVGSAYHEAGRTSRENPNYGRETEINRQTFVRKWGGKAGQ